MINVSGQALLQQIRADARLKKTYVVVATSDAQLADEMRSAADFVFVKPTSYSQLRDFAIHLRREED